MCSNWSPTDEANGAEKPETIVKIKEQDLAGKRKIEKADPNDILPHLRVLEETDNPQVLRNHLARLVRTARGKRVAHMPEILSFYDKALEDTKYQGRNLRKLIDLVGATLSVERYYRLPNYDNNIQRIQAKPLESIVRIVGDSTDQEVILVTLYFFEQNDEKESVEAVFGLVKRLNQTLYNNLKGFMWDVLFKEDSVLRRTQGRLIDEKIDELLEHEEPRVRQRVEEMIERA